MFIFLLAVHIVVAVLLIVVVLVQRGRGGGLVESFSGVESMFGTKTNVFLTRITAVLATLFLITSISLAVLASRQSRSLIDENEASPAQEKLADVSPDSSQEQEAAAKQENLPD